MSGRDKPASLHSLGDFGDEDATEEVGATEVLQPPVLPDFDDDPATEAIEHAGPVGLPPDHQVLRALGSTDGRECFEVLQTRLGRVLILEVAAAGDDDFEAWLARRASLTQPGVLQVYEVGVLDDGRSYFTHGRAGGLGFLDWSQRATTPALVTAVVNAAQVVGSAHATGVAHGAIDETNLRVLPSGLVMVVNWASGTPREDVAALAQVLERALRGRVPPRLAVVLKRASSGQYVSCLALADALQDVLRVG